VESYENNTDNNYNNDDIIKLENDVVAKSTNIFTNEKELNIICSKIKATHANLRYINDKIVKSAIRTFSSNNLTYKILEYNNSYSDEKLCKLKDATFPLKRIKTASIEMITPISIATHTKLSNFFKSCKIPVKKNNSLQLLKSSKNLQSRITRNLSNTLVFRSSSDVNIQCKIFYFLIF